MDLGYTERIDVTLCGGKRLRDVVEAHRETISREALCASLQLVEKAGSPSDEWQQAVLQDELLVYRVTRQS